MGRVCIAAFALVLLAPTSGSALADTAPSPMEIFAKHAAAVGYSLSDGREKPYRLEETVTYEGTTVRQIVRQAGAYSRIDRLGATASTSFGFDGHAFWYANENGNVSLDTGFDRPYDVTHAVIRTEAFDPSVTPEALPPTSTDYVIRIHPPSGVIADLYFNKTSFYIDKTVVDPGGSYEEITTYDQYKRFGDVAVAMRWERRDVTYEITKFEWDAPLQQDDFSRPAPRDYAVFPPSGVTTIAFDSKHDGVVFEATINGVKGHFLLDTGADSVFVSERFAAAAGLHGSKAGAVMGIGGTTRSSNRATVSSMRIGDVTLRDFSVTVIPMSDERVDGWVGYDVLAQAVCSIDFDKHTLQFANPATWHDDQSRGALIFALDELTPQIQVLIDRKLSSYMDLDTGDSGSMTFTRRFADANPGIIKNNNQGRVIGAGGIEDIYIGQLDQIDIGPFKFYGLAAEVLLGFKGYAAQRATQGLIGYQLLRRFNLAFDYRNSRVYMALNNYGSGTRF